MSIKLYSEKSKAEIRKPILAIRDGLSVETRIENSILAAELAKDSISFEPGTVVSAFFPIRSEIDPRPLMDHLRILGAILCLPVVIDRTRIVFRELVRGAGLVDTGFGSKGPNKETRVVDPQIMLMPLAVFDCRGGRIGYGAGYYDRAIYRLIELDRRPAAIGMAFDCQRYEFVPQQPHDIAMDAIVTESGYREFDSIEPEVL